ncbi:MAG: ACP S-malonyltransferase [Syntrophomonas sp.]
MSRLAFVFPGQGAQYPGMGRELAEKYPEAAQVFAQADEIAGFKLSDICFNGPAEQLNTTIYAQPALLTTNLAILKVAQSKGLFPVMLAGLSLGEYSALIAAGSISFAQALPLVQKRARLMQEAVPPDQGAMAAVLGLDNQVVEDVCFKQHGIVSIANYNCPGQVVISGEKQAVLQASSILKDAGGRIAPLAVSVPSHCQLMHEAAVQLTPYLTSIEWKQPKIDVVSNVNAQTNPSSLLAEMLARQLFSPVRWEQSIRYMMEKVDYFIEVGPGSSLSGLIKRIDKTRLLGQIGDVASLEKVLAKVESL